MRLIHGRPYDPQIQGKDERRRRVYNKQRPHEALGMDVAASRYSASRIGFQEMLAVPEYDPANLIGRVRHGGFVGFKGRKARLSEAFAHLDVAFRPTARDVFGPRSPYNSGSRQSRQ